MREGRQLQFEFDVEAREKQKHRSTFAEAVERNARHVAAQNGPADLGGPKFDGGKTRMDLVLQGFPKALMAVGDVATFGAQKYAPHSWKTVPDAHNRYKAAQYRHELAAHIEGDYDLESGLLHAAHAAWNALATLELFIEELEAGGPANGSGGES